MKSTKDLISVLIADDNRKSADMLKSIINSDDELEIVGVANDGKLAYNMILEKEPDVVILDIIMLNLDGLDIMYKVMKDTIIKHPAFIVVSAIGTDSVIDEAFNIGASYYIIKPFESATLVNKIKVMKNSTSCVVDEEVHTYIKEVKDTDLNDRIVASTSAIIKETIGIKTSFTGYKFLREAVLMVVNNISLLDGQVTKVIYPDVAKKYNTLPSRVERAIRYAVEYTWTNNDDIEEVNKLIGFTSNYGKSYPTNTEIIATIADMIRLDYNLI